MTITLEPTEEYIIIPLRVFEKVMRYAIAFCENMCPANRDPETCIYIVTLAKVVGLGLPPCVYEYGGFNVKVFEEIVKEIERKYRQNIEQFVLNVSRRGPKSLEENIDLYEAKFALGVLKSLRNRKKVYLAKGSNISISDAITI